MIHEKEYLTPREIGERFKIHPQTIRRLAVAGKIPGSVRIGRSVRIPLDYIEGKAILFQKEQPADGKEGKQE